MCLLWHHQVIIITPWFPKFRSSTVILNSKTLEPIALLEVLTQFLFLLMAFLFSMPVSKPLDIFPKYFAYMGLATVFFCKLTSDQ